MLVEAVTLYHMVIEGMLALTGQHFIMDFNERKGTLPGLRRGLRQRRPRRAPPRRLRLGLPAREGARGRALQDGDPADAGRVAAGRRRGLLAALGGGRRRLRALRLLARGDPPVRRHLPDAPAESDRPGLSPAGALRRFRQDASTVEFDRVRRDFFGAAALASAGGASSIGGRRRGRRRGAGWSSPAAFRGDGDGHRAFAARGRRGRGRGRPRSLLRLRRRR